MIWLRRRQIARSDLSVQPGTSIGPIATNRSARNTENLGYLIEIQAREILSLRERMNEILAAHTGKSAEEIARDTERDYHMTGEEAQAYGLIDRVVERRVAVGPRANGSNGSGDGSSSGGNGS